MQAGGKLVLDQIVHALLAWATPAHLAVDTVDDNVYVSSLQGSGTSGGGLATFTRVSSGPPQPNTLSITYSAMWGLNFTTGVFDDTISEITPATVHDLNVNGGDGNNTVNLTDWNNFTSVTTGAGADNVAIHSFTKLPAVTPVNVADNPDAVATQSSTLNGLGAGNAIDGDASTISLTNNDVNGYWQDALGSTYLLSSIAITFNGPLPEIQNSNFRVSVLNDGTETFGQDYFVGSGDQPLGVPLDVTLPNGVFGDTIKIQFLGVSNLGLGLLQLGDVQARPPPALPWIPAGATTM